MNEILRLRVFYKKEGISRFISHKSFCKLIERSLRKTEVPVRFSQGFTPHIKISFGPPLPIPIVGLNEFFEVELKEFINFSPYMEKINLFLPDGSKIKDFCWVKNKFSISQIKGIYFIPKEKGLPIKNQIEKYGEKLEEEESYIKVIFKMEGLNHKKIFVNGIFDGIKRELVIQNEQIQSAYK